VAARIPLEHWREFDRTPATSVKKRVQVLHSRRLRKPVPGVGSVIVHYRELPLIDQGVTGAIFFGEWFLRWSFSLKPPVLEARSGC
jgi:hypothetical protein